MTADQPSTGDAWRADSPPASTTSKANRPSTPRLAADLRARLERHVGLPTLDRSLVVLGHHNLARRETFDVLARSDDPPERAVLGFVLPVQYDAIAVFAESVVATPPSRRHADASLAVAVDRSGHSVSMLATVDGVVETTEPQGWLVDACQRAVGLSTAHCNVESIEYPLALWLDRLMVAILSQPNAGPLSWKAAAAMCPVPRRWTSYDPSDLGTTLASTTPSWRALRNAAAQGECAPVGIEASWASWMDDPMFARWCMGYFPDVANLWADVEFLASPHLANCVELTIRSARSAGGRSPTIE